MKVTLPIIGRVVTGSDIPVKSKAPKEKVEKILPDMSAGFLDLSDKGLSGEKEVSKKLIQSFFSWVFANVSVLAEEISKAEFELFKTVLIKGEPQFAEINQHPILDLLDKPNPFTTTSQLIYNTEAHLELTGDAFWLLDRPNNPTNIFVLQPDKVTVNPGDDKDQYFIKNYTYKDTVDGKTTEVIYEPELIIHFKTPNPGNPYRGKSVVEATATSIDVSNLSREFLKNFFKNGAVPNFAISSDQRINETDVKRIKEQLKKEYGGVANAFKTMILGGGLKPVTVQQTGQQMQLLELMNAMRDEIMAMFKNTKASLGIVEDVNRANAEATLLGWKQSVIKPKLMRITDTINEFLIPKFGTNLTLGFCDPVPENKEDDIKQVVDLMGTNVRQVMTVNEARTILDLDPLPGDEFNTITSAVVPAPVQDPTPKSLRNISLKQHMRRNGINTYIEIQRNIYESAKAVARQMLKKKAKKKAEPQKPEEKRQYHNFSHEQASEYWHKQIHLTEVVEQQFEDKINRFIEGLEEKTVRSLHETAVPKSVKRFKAKDIFDQDEEVQAGINLFEPLQFHIAELAGSEAYQLMKLSTIYNPSARLNEQIKTAVEEFTKSFVATDKEKLTSILENGIREGQSVAQIERAIRDQFESFRKNQSAKIARTEVLRASNAGQLDAFRASGVVEGKQWLTTMDGREDDDCAALDGTIVSLESDFFATDYGSGEQPPLHPNCRCALLPVLVTEKADAELIKLAKENERLSKQNETLNEENAELTQLLNG